MPVAVPPIEDYECKIFESSCLPATRSGVYLLQMYGRSFFYTFQVKPIGKMLQIRKDTTTINQYA